MFRPGSSLTALPVLVLLGVPSVWADLEITGEVVSRTPQIEVRVVVTNPGDEPAVPLDVVGELFGQRREARVARGVPAGGEAAVILGFDPQGARPGTHALTLLLEHPTSGSLDAAGNRPVESQRAYLPLTLGPLLAPVLALEVECEEEASCTTSMDVKGAIPVRLGSLDGQAREVSVRVLTARGLRPASAPVVREVPKAGTVSLLIPIARSGASPGSRHGVLLLAETPGEALSRAIVAQAVVEISPNPSLLLRLRPLLLIVGLLLLAAAAVAEWRRERAGDRSIPSPGGPDPSADPGP